MILKMMRKIKKYDKLSIIFKERKEKTEGGCKRDYNVSFSTVRLLLYGKEFTDGFFRKRFFSKTADAFEKNINKFNLYYIR
jgi:hypothetical protein